VVPGPLKYDSSKNNILDMVAGGGDNFFMKSMVLPMCLAAIMVAVPAFSPAQTKAPAAPSPVSAKPKAATGQ
jgi:hypothetical protein